MAEKPTNTSLTLGFLGGNELHRENVKALISNFVGGFLRNHRGAKVRFIVCVEPFTSTMSDLADYCLTEGHQLGLIGHENSFKSQEIQTLLPQADGLIIRLTPNASLAKSMVATLANYNEESRLILLSNPNEDDLAYNALLLAVEKDVMVRSMLDGLELLVMESDESDDEEEKEVPKPDLHSIEGGNGGDEVDLDALAAAADNGDGESAEELHELAEQKGIDPNTIETWVEVVQLMRAQGEEADGEAEEPDGEEAGDEEAEEASGEEAEEEGEEEVADGVDEEGYYDAEADPDAEVESDDEEEVVVDEEAEVEEDDETVEQSAEGDDGDNEGSEDGSEEDEEEQMAGKGKYTRAQLERHAENNPEKLKEIAAKHGIYPGRGIKMSMMVERVLDAQGGKPAAAKKTTAKKTAAKKTAKRTSKKAPAKKRVAAKKAPAKKKVAGKKAPAKKVVAGKKTAPVRTPAASLNGHVDKATVRSFLKVSRAALDVAESLLG